MNLSDKTILLTGATGGIGSILSTKLSSLGANVITVGRDPAKSANYHVDLSDREQRQEFINSFLADHKTLDILIHAAGIGIYKPLADITPADWYSSYELNVATPFFLAQQIKPQLNIMLGSCSALQHKPNRSPYNSTKAALRSLTLCLQTELPTSFTHITLDSTLTAFGSLSLAEKKTLQNSGKIYLDPDWVAERIINIIQLDQKDPEYVLSPDCYPSCGTWHKP